MKKVIIFADLERMTPTQLCTFGQVLSLIENLEEAGAIAVRSTLAPSRKGDRPPALLRRADAVLSTLRDHPEGLLRGELCALLDAPDGSISPAISLLLSDKRVRTDAKRGRNGAGKYYINPMKEES